jgi:hypothetical protein
LGPSFVLGAIFWVFPVQLLGSGLLLNSIWLVTLFLASIWRRPRIPAAAANPHQSAFLATTVGLTLLFLSGEWPQFSIAGVVVLAIDFATMRVAYPKRDLILLSTALFLILATVGVVSKFAGSYWWIVTDDYSYHEAMRVHLANYGIWTPWGTTDVSLYHWFTNAWIGQVAQITLAEPWVTLTRVAPVVFGSSLAASLLLFGAFCLKSIRNYPRRLIVVTSAFVILTMRVDLTSPSTYAVLAIIATGLVILKISANFEDRRVLLLAGLFMSLFLAAIFTKFTSIVSVVILAPHTLYALAPITSRNWRSWFVMRLIAVFAALAFLGLAGSVLSNGWRFGVTDGFENAIQGSLGLSATYLLATCALVLTKPVLAHFKVGAPAVKQHRVKLPIIESLVLSAVCLVLLIPQLAVDIRNYFALPLLLIACTCLFDSQEEVLTRRSMLPTLLIGTSAFAAVFATRMGAHLDFGIQSWADFATWSAHHWAFLGLAILILGFGMNSVFMALHQRLRVNLALALTVGGVLLALTSLVQRMNELNADNFSRDTARVTSVIGDQRLVEVGLWLGKNTSSSELFATDLLCESGANKEGAVAKQTSCVQSSVDMTLAHSSRRRFLVLAPRFSYQNPGKTEASVSLSLKFAESLGAREAKQLVSRGVTHFVLDNRYGQTRALALSPAVAFSNNRYLVIKLEDLGPKIAE